MKLTPFLTRECPSLATAVAEIGQKTLEPERFWQLVTTGTAAERKAFGLFGFIGGHSGLTMAAWETLDLSSESDPLVDALIGNSYLHSGRLELGYVRMMRALDAYPSSALLNVLVADVSLRLGDAAVARRLLERCDRSQFDAIDTTCERVSADLAWLEGRIDEARAAYDRLAPAVGDVNPIARLRRAVLDEQRGDWEAAWSKYADCAFYSRYWIEPRHGYQRCSESWWSGLSAAERRAAVRAAAADDPTPFHLWDVVTAAADLVHSSLNRSLASHRLLTTLRFDHFFPARPYAPALQPGPPFLWRDELRRDARADDPLPIDGLLGLRCTAQLVRTDALWRSLPSRSREAVLLAAYAIDRKVASVPAQQRAGAIASDALGRCARAVLELTATLRGR